MADNYGADDLQHLEGLDAVRLAEKRNTWLNRPSLFETHPQLALELEDPEMGHRLTMGSTKRVPWCCRVCQHRWVTTANHRTYHGSGCPKCNDAVRGERNIRRAAEKHGLFADTHPELVNEMLHPELAEIYSSQSKVVTEWRCGSCGHEWAASLRNRARGTGCHPCRRALVGRRSQESAVLRRGALSETHPSLAAELVNPSDGHRYSAGSSRVRLLWRCGECEGEWLAKIPNRVRGEGCPKCAHYGFNPGKSASLYLLVGKVDGHKVAQFGISNDIERRLREHRRSGFTSPPRTVVHGPGSDIRDLERTLIAEQRRLGIATARESGFGFVGATEAFVLDTPLAFRFLADIKQLIAEYQHGDPTKAA